MKHFYKSKTTQTIGQASAISAGIVLALITALRRNGIIPWPVEHDAAIAVVIATTGINILSRLLALKRPHPIRRDW